jgi:hypothetical protein
MRIELEHNGRETVVEPIGVPPSSRSTLVAREHGFGRRARLPFGDSARRAGKGGTPSLSVAAAVPTLRRSGHLSPQFRQEVLYENQRPGTGGR